jgi:hypothetical protein
VARPDGSEPLVVCAACRARYGDDPPARDAGARRDASLARAAQPVLTKPARASRHREDRVRRVVRELPKGEYTTGSIAKAATGLNQTKTLRRLRQLAESGEIRQLGKRWSTERPPAISTRRLTGRKPEPATCGSFGTGRWWGDPSQRSRRIGQYGCRPSDGPHDSDDRYD